MKRLASLGISLFWTVVVSRWLLFRDGYMKRLASLGVLPFDGYGDFNRFLFDDVREFPKIVSLNRFLKRVLFLKPISQTDSSNRFLKPIPQTDSSKLYLQPIPETVTLRSVFQYRRPVGLQAWARVLPRHRHGLE